MNFLRGGIFLMFICHILCICLPQGAAGTKSGGQGKGRRCFSAGRLYAAGYNSIHRDTARLLSSGAAIFARGGKGMAVQKSTGWKVPLLFCLAVLIPVGIATLLTPKESPVLQVPEPLMQAMRTERIDLAATEEGRRWQSEITSAAGGFADAEEKDRKVRRVLDAAVAAGRFDAACTASVLMHDAGRRDAALAFIAEEAAAQCAQLVWGGMAAAALHNADMRGTWEQRLSLRWRECGGVPAGAAPAAQDAQEHGAQ